jgi:3-phenylpropionate/trans-cinnamate dioxygenase ferredoxin reductase subunit
MSDVTRFVIVGGGLAAAKAAGQLVDDGFGGEITMVSAEAELPYERPPLSKGYLTGDSDFDAALVHAEDFYDRHVDLRRGVRATSLDVDTRTIGLGDGTELRYEGLLLATGSSPRSLDVPGGETMVTLRTKEDADALRASLRPGARVVVVGGGWIGLEVAAAARGSEAQVTLLEASAAPLSGVLGETVGQIFASLHERNGVSVRTGVTVERVTDDGVVVDGETVPADVVVAGVGVAPDVTLAEQAGLRVDDGILVDASLQASADGVFAAGDVAACFYPRYSQHVRVEHWANALNQGLAAARSMAGEIVRYDRLPYFYTDQYELGMEYVGWVPPSRLQEAQVEIRGDVDALAFRAYWLLPDERGLRAAAAMHVNMWDDGADALKAVVDSRETVDVDSLR